MPARNDNALFDVDRMIRGVADARRTPKRRPGDDFGKGPGRGPRQPWIGELGGTRPPQPPQPLQPGGRYRPGPGRPRPSKPRRRPGSDPRMAAIASQLAAVRAA